jgi:hypothetical protein
VGIIFVKLLSEIGVRSTNIVAKYAARKNFSLLILGLVGLALCVAAGLFIRNSEGYFVISSHNLGRLLTVLVCFAIAGVFNRSTPDFLLLFLVCTGIQMLSLILTYIPPLILPEPLLQDIKIIYDIAGVFEGVATAGIVLLFLYFFSKFKTRYFIVTLSLVYTISHILFFVTLHLPSSLDYWLKPLFLLGSLVLLFFCLRRMGVYKGGGGVKSTPKWTAKAQPALLVTMTRKLMREEY